LKNKRIYSQPAFSWKRRHLTYQRCKCGKPWGLCRWLGHCWRKGRALFRWKTPMEYSCADGIQLRCRCWWFINLTMSPKWLESSSNEELLRWMSVELGIMPPISTEAHFYVQLVRQIQMIFGANTVGTNSNYEQIQCLRTVQRSYCFGNAYCPEQRALRQ